MTEYRLADQRAVATASVLAAAVMYGTTGTSQALADAGGSSYAVGAGRLLVGAAGLVVLAALTGSAVAVVRISRTWAGLVAAAAMAGYQACFFAGVARTGVAVGTLIGIGSGPLFTGLLAALVDRARPTLAWLRGTAIALIGLAFLTVGGSPASHVDWLGVLLMLGAGLSYAITTIAQRRLISDRSHPPAEVMAAVFGGAALLLFPVLLVTGPGWLATGRGAALALYLGLVPTTLAYVLVGRALRILPAATVASLNLAEPLTAALLGVVVLGERFSALGTLGVLLVFAGLIVLAQPRTSHLHS